MRASAFRIVVAFATLTAGSAHALVIDFNTLPAGHVLTNGDLPPGFSVVVDNQRKGHPDNAIIFDSDCPPDGDPSDCTGGDEDLKTPGVGIANDVAQQKVLVIAEDIVDTDPTDGFVDDPDDEMAGGKITFNFPAPSKLLSLRLIDIDVNEPLTWVELLLTGGGTQIVNAEARGNNSAQTVVIPTPVPDIDGFRVVFDGSGAIDDITLLSCGDNTVDQGEQCDGTDDDACPGACLQNCTCPSATTTSTSTSTTTTESSTTTTTVPVTTTSTVTTTTVASTTTTVPATTTTTPPTTSTSVPSTTTTSVTATTTTTLIGGSTTTTLPGTTTTSTTIVIPVCGDGVVNQPSEVCDGADNAACSGGTCRGDCTCTICGDGIVNGNEVCEPPNVGACNSQCRLAACPLQIEVCNNQVDDDGDGLVDCVDPDCPFDVFVPCGCAEIKKDPARIRFDRNGGDRDYLSIHGHFAIADDLDLDAARFAVVISNVNGQVYRGTLAAGELRRKIGGKGRYVYRDTDAAGDADGIYRVGTRVIERHGKRNLHFRVKAYGDFSAATLALMTTQIIADDQVGALRAEWRRTNSGWILRQKFFGDVD